MHLAQAAWKLRPDVESAEPVLLWLVTSGALAIEGDPSAHPLQGPVWGAARCLMLESEGAFEVFCCDLDPKDKQGHQNLWKELSYVSSALGDVPNDFEIAYPFYIYTNNIFH